MTLDDAILAATGGPTVSDGMRAWFIAQGAPDLGSLDDIERAFLRIQMPVFPELSTSDLWFEYLGTQGFTGDLNDRKLQYWVNELVAGTSPSNDTLPVVTGQPQSSNTLTCSTGVWTDAESYTFRWLDNGTPIIGATQQTFGLNPTHIGKEISCLVTASNTWGSTSANPTP